MWAWAPWATHGPCTHVNPNGGDEPPRGRAAFGACTDLLSYARVAGADEPLYEGVVRFACRGASEPGSPSFHAELADPEAAPNEAFGEPVDEALRHVAASLLDGTDAALRIERVEHTLQVSVGRDEAEVAH